jgi:voltage-gated potassium channel Kch
MNQDDNSNKLPAQTLRILAAVAVIILALGAFAAGVGTTGIPDMYGEPLAGWLYYTAGLFVFGGLDLGTPVGGPLTARTALWIAYFLAPAVTTSVIVETMLMMVRPELIARRRLQQHVILIGSSNEAQAYADAIHSIEPERLVVRLDHRPKQAPHYSEGLLKRSLLHLQGDVRLPETLDIAGLEKAYRVIFFTDDDLVNLEGAWSTLARRPELPVAAHVTDLALLRPVNRLLRNQRHKTESNPVPLVFSTYRIGALHLYEQYLHPYFESTGYRDVVVIAGFGHYSQTILELLCAMAADELDHILVVDPDAARLLRQLRSDVDTGEVNIATVDGELDDPGTWLQITDQLTGQDVAPLFLLNSADEGVNFKAAMLLRDQVLASKIFVSCFLHSPFAEALSTELSVDIVATEELLSDALRDHYDALTSLKT